MAESDLPIQIQPRDLEVLTSLFESRIMTSRHIAALHFDGKEEAAKKRLQKLKAAKLVADRTQRVNELSILFLTRKAYEILEHNGILQNFPALGISAFEKRAQVADATIRHELEVLDVKTAIVSAIRKEPNYVVEEFTTWPTLNAFRANLPGEISPRTVRPDGFMNISGRDEEGACDYTFFLELDQSSESQEVLALKAACYADCYRSGEFAIRRGAKREEYKEYPFRVLFVLQNQERRNNTAEALLKLKPPVLTLVYLSAIDEVRSDPLGAIWIRPVDYRDAMAGTTFDTGRERTTWVYKRQPERELLAEKSVKKFSLFE